jgi:hypothetical protein
MRSKTAFTARVALAFAMLLLTPLAFKSGEGVQPNTACSEEEQSGPTCAREIDSLCTAGSKPVINWYTRAN